MQLSSDDDTDIEEEDEDFFKMIFGGAMMGEMYLDMFIKKILPGRQPQVEWGLCWSFSTLQENAIGNCA
jgi:hypothetical protein